MVLISNSFSSDETNIEKLLESSGITKQVKSLPEAFQIGIEQTAARDKDFSSQLSLVLTNSANKTLKPQIVLGQIKQTLRESLTDEEIKNLLDWYQSDLGETITALEIESSSAKAYQEMILNAEAFLKDKERVAFAKSFDSLTKSTELIIDIQKFTMFAFYTALSKASNPEKNVNYKPVEKQFTQMESSFKQQIQQGVTLALVFTYQSLSKEQLVAYENFLKEKDTQKFIKESIKGLNKGLQRVITDLSNEVALYSSSLAE